MIHVSPPFKTPEPIATNPNLAAGTGYLDVNTKTLQHNKYSNIFGIGDNINIPSTKTAAGAAAQSGIVEKNLKEVMAKREPVVFYDGYTSCPLVTGGNKGILAEFDINGQPLQVCMSSLFNWSRTKFLIFTGPFCSRTFFHFLSLTFFKLDFFTNSRTAIAGTFLSLTSL